MWGGPQMNNRDAAESDDDEPGALAMLEQPAPGLVTLHMQVRGRRPVSDLIARLGGIDGVVAVGVLDESELD